MATRVLVVDDSPLTQRRVAELVSSVPGFRVAGTASNGLAALERAQALRPDLVTLDLNMPVMDGLATLKHMMAQRPVATVVVSSFATEESHLTFDCLRYGAVDFVTKPSGLDGGLPADKEREIVSCLQRAASVPTARLCFRRLRERAAQLPSWPKEPAQGVVVLVAGRSGVASLLHALSVLPSHPGLAAVVLLDMPTDAARSFAGYAARFASLEAVPLASDTALHGGTAYVSAVSRGLLVIADGGGPRLRSFPMPVGADRRGALSALLSSIGESFGPRLTVGLLSGTPAEAVAPLGEVASLGGSLLVEDPGLALEDAALVDALQTQGADRIFGWEGLAAVAAASLTPLMERVVA